MTSLGPFASLDEVLAGARFLLLDFDGVVCQLYASGSPARKETADRVRAVLAEHRVSLPDAIAETDDPIAILASASTLGNDAAAQADAVLGECELAAVPAAEPNGYVHDVVVSARESGRLVVVVSSCAARAVDAYLERASLTSLIGSTITRTSDDLRAISGAGLIARCFAFLGADPAECALVTARADLLEAAAAAELPAIAYQRDRSEFGVPASRYQAALTSLADLVLRLRARPVQD
jgi:beta-phosphoglucomutase-like phosphatase (HAD superfamily)